VPFEPSGGNVLDALATRQGTTRAKTAAKRLDGEILKTIPQTDGLVRFGTPQNLPVGRCYPPGVSGPDSRNHPH
jgi:hypothetical protein